MASIYFDQHDPSATPSLGSFISLWTLSLTPLISHVITGVPQRVYLVQASPNLMDRLVLWNPTSILWRYFAIFDRRIRAKRWDKDSLATSNAVFWTEYGWDGAEDVSDRNRLYLTRIPRKTHVELLSASFAQTVLVALQGIQALYQIVSIQQFTTHNFGVLPIIFLPFALFGIFRLPSAYWLTEQYAFADARDNPESKSKPRQPSFRLTRSCAKDDTFSNATELLPIAGLEQELSPPFKPIDQPSNRFHPTSSWRGVLVRLFFQIPTLGYAALALAYLSLTGHRDYGLTAATLCMIVTYVFFTVVTAVLFLVNFFRGASHTTVIPGIRSMWYKLYTCILFAMALVMFILASLEQIQPPCDEASCQGLTEWTDFSLTFNATSNLGLWEMGGFINASYVIVGGKYTGFMTGVSTKGTFNSTLGS
jgi:hypothetical protein